MGHQQKLSKNGTYELVLDNPKLLEAKDRYDSDRRTKSLRSKPTLLAQTMWGGENAFKVALAAGQVWYKAGSDGNAVEWREADDEHEEGTHNRWSTTQDKALTAPRFDAVRAFVENTQFADLEVSDWVKGAGKAIEAKWFGLNLTKANAAGIQCR